MHRITLRYSLLSLAAATLLTACAHPARSRPAPAAAQAAAPIASPAVTGEPEARALLAAQVDAWNRHDLDGFLAGYRKDEHVVFVTQEGSSRGYAELEQRYRRTYNAPEKFGELRFENLDFTGVDSDSVVARGTWRLVRQKDSPHGRFVLVVCRLPEGWRIVSDFTTVESTGG